MSREINGRHLENEWVLCPGLMAKDEACPAENDMILKRIHLRKGELTRDRLSALRVEKTRAIPPDKSQSEGNHLWDANGTNSPHLKWVATFFLRLHSELPKSPLWKLENGPKVASWHFLNIGRTVMSECSSERSIPAVFYPRTQSGWRSHDPPQGSP